MKILPLLVIIVLLVGMFLFAQRAKQRTADQVSARQASIVVGSRVMTTSGLYGRVVSMNSDADTVQLAIAPGIEVTWAFAALRDATELPEQYRRGVGDTAETLAAGDSPRSQPSTSTAQQSGAESNRE